jgi:magnesium-transporting ATPase (P-type)
MDIPVDGLIIKCSGVMSNEAAMTGESDGGKKGGAHDVTSPVLLSGT